MKKRTLLLLVLVVAVLAAAVPAFAGRDPDVAAKGRPLKNNLYIVQMIEDPVVAYDGGIAGYPATQPAAGKKIDPRASKVVEGARRIRADGAKTKRSPSTMSTNEPAVS